MNPTAYIEATIEAAESRLERDGIALDFARLIRQEWMEDHPIYGCTIYATNSKPEHPIDSLSAKHTKLCQLIAAAESYLEAFGKGGKDEALRAMEWQRLERWMSTIEESERKASKAGEESAKQRAANIVDFHREVLISAMELIEKGKSSRDIARIISKKIGMTDRQIRNIFKKTGLTAAFKTGDYSDFLSLLEDKHKESGNEPG